MTAARPRRATATDPLVTVWPYAASTPGRSQLFVADEAADARLQIVSGVTAGVTGVTGAVCHWA
jgi:hypothetical protein